MSSIHIRHLNPLPPDLDDILDRFERVLVPELNTGQLLRVLRNAFARPFLGLNKVQGQPFQVREIEAEIEKLLEEGETRGKRSMGSKGRSGSFGT